MSMDAELLWRELHAMPVAYVEERDTSSKVTYDRKSNMPCHELRLPVLQEQSSSSTDDGVLTEPFT